MFVNFLTAAIARRFEPLFERHEDRLDRQGRWRDAQKLRYKHHEWMGGPPRKAWKSLFDYVRVVTELRFSIQRERYLQSRHDTLYERLNEAPSAADSGELVTEMQEQKRQLHALLRTIWRLEQKKYNLISRMPNRALKRALEAHRGRNWHLSDWMEAECAGAGGCCGRRCGCCRRQRSEKRPHHRSHCTSACLCCTQARGFEINVAHYMEDPMIGKLPELRSPWDDYKIELMHAYIWGD
ncbi:hypothetical protein BO70DRAFT_427690 [Aspergillus heteromorphus CBS 117.55]|uniref:Uncharacterized protein n=1 Tax=Aspergillus heteromorphus CBS 117.55 TaxID=1448321 RepID=A0A317WR68_9EURO|nr:uncharacterized protein BO70DRAFT_427690 [Aspergillus heteromorphus CBS 117.55]PWY86650.1 hypothetical protein BO70DRAFT_427690 [Aspergillus heteromorphus CBS 117.55]